MNGIMISGDYASVESRHFSCYYGYEHTKDDELCFIAKTKTGEILIEKKFSQLVGLPRNAKQCDVEECIMAGIAMLLDALEES